MFSSTSFAEWTKIGDTVEGAAIYVDFERIRKYDGHVYWWDMQDLPKPDNLGILSRKTYYQGDCKRFRFKTLSVHASKEPMAVRLHEIFNYETGDWQYPAPNSAMELEFNLVCNR